MAIREGRCPNCGSILHLDGNSEKGHCLFCDAVFLTRTAFEITADPKSYTFPNLPQPKYEGPSLQPNFMADVSGKGQKGQVKKTPKPIPPVYIPKEPEKLPDIKMSPKAKKRTLLISVISIVVIAAVSVPLILYRNETRAVILGQMNEIAPFTVNAEQAVAIRRLDSSYLMIASGEDISKDDMIKLFRNYCEKRAMTLDLDTSDFNKVYRSVTVKLVMPGGGFLIAEPDTQAALDSGSAIEMLN